MRVLVVGADGLLGTSIVDVFDEHPLVTTLITTNRHELDVRNEADVTSSIARWLPDVVVNAAALMPADRCDTDPAEAYRVNTLGARWIGRACAATGAVPVYVSTDYVFGDIEDSTAHEPDARTNPILTYGTTKLAGEYETKIACDRAIVARTAGLFGPPPRSRTARPCFVDRVLETAARGESVTIVEDIVLSPTYTRDFAAMLLELLQTGSSGTFHLVNRGSASWYEIGSFALRRSGLAKPRPSRDGSAYASSPRPRRTPLGGSLPISAERRNRDWRDALDAYLGSRTDQHADQSDLVIPLDTPPRPESRSPQLQPVSR